MLQFGTKKILDVRERLNTIVNSSRINICQSQMFLLRSSHLECLRKQQSTPNVPQFEGKRDRRQSDRAKLTLTGRFSWWPSPCRVCGTSPTVPCPRESLSDRLPRRLPRDDEVARGDGAAPRVDDAVPEGAARCATYPGATEAWVASSLAHQDHPGDGGATLPPRPPEPLLPRACAALGLNLKRQFYFKEWARPE